MCPIYPTWQLKQGMQIDGEYYIDQVNCFSSSASFAIFVSVNSLVSWIATQKRRISCLMTDVDDTSGAAMSTNMDYYEPYHLTCPAPQAALLRLWDELHIPHKQSKQLHSNTLPIIGIVVNLNQLSYSLLEES